MLIAPAITYGIDTKIKKVQEYLDNNLSWQSPVIYGRVYQSPKGEEIVPEVYLTDGEYTQIFVNDTENAQIGFLVTDREINRATVDVIFTGNLDGIYGGSSVRLDEKALIEAKRVLDDCGFVLVTGLKIGIADVFAGFTLDKIRHANMQPYFCFSYTVEMPYYDDFCQ